jgi:hypothetical protein
MSHALLDRLKLRRGAYLWACFRLEFLEVAHVQGDIAFLFGTEDDPNRPVLYLDSLNLVIDQAKKLGGRGGTPSACLLPGSRPPVEFDPKSRRFGASFEAMVDFPAVRLYGKGEGEKRETDPKTDTPGPTGLRAEMELRGQFLSELRPIEYGYEMLEAELSITLPDVVEEQLDLPQLVLIPIKIPLIWIRLTSHRELKLQPVFIAADGTTPPTGADFYPGLQNANELWGRCCIDFTAKCPIYVDEQDWRVATQNEAVAFKDSRNVSDAVEVFIVEELDPVDLWGGGATFASGTATAKVVSTDNQLPLNQNHMAHELGHVLGLDHPPPGTSSMLVDGCAGSVMEPSGFFADNPGFQCEANCDNASNPLLRLVPPTWCVSVNRPDDQLF